MNSFLGWIFCEIFNWVVLFVDWGGTWDDEKETYKGWRGVLLNSMDWTHSLGCWFYGRSL